jgi:hypothetical protein
MPNRTVCSVLEEMRKCNETRNYSYLLGLIEEVQTIVNRMEAGLYDKGDINYITKELRELKAEKKKLKAEIEELELKKDFISENK